MATSNKSVRRSFLQTMAKMHATLARGNPSGSIIVDRPRAGDDVGVTLRNIFGGDCQIPLEMQRLLAMLDRSNASLT